jgi:hypothetical protein
VKKGQVHTEIMVPFCLCVSRLPPNHILTHLLVAVNHQYKNHQERVLPVYGCSHAEKVQKMLTVLCVRFEYFSVD